MTASFNHQGTQSAAIQNPLLPKAIVVCAFAVFSLATAVVLQAGYDWFAPTLAMIVVARFAVGQFFRN